MTELQDHSVLPAFVWDEPNMCCAWTEKEREKAVYISESSNFGQKLRLATEDANLVYTNASIVSLFTCV